MAKKGKKKSAGTRRRGRVGGINITNVLTKVAGNMAGGVAGQFASQKFMKGQKPIVKGLVLGLGGGVLAEMVPALQHVGAGVAAVGGIELAKGLGVVSGADDSETVEVAVSGVEDFETMGVVNDTLGADDYDETVGADENEFEN